MSRMEGGDSLECEFEDLLAEAEAFTCDPCLSGDVEEAGHEDSTKQPPEEVSVRKKSFASPPAEEFLDAACDVSVDEGGAAETEVSSLRVRASHKRPSPLDSLQKNSTGTASPLLRKRPRVEGLHSRDEKSAAEAAAEKGREEGTPETAEFSEAAPIDAEEEAAVLQARSALSPQPFFFDISSVPFVGLVNAPPGGSCEAPCLRPFAARTLPQEAEFAASLPAESNNGWALARGGYLRGCLYTQKVQQRFSRRVLEKAAASLNCEANAEAGAVSSEGLSAASAVAAGALRVSPVSADANSLHKSLSAPRYLPLLSPAQRRAREARSSLSTQTRPSRSTFDQELR